MRRQLHVVAGALVLLCLPPLSSAALPPPPVARRLPDAAHASLVGPHGMDAALDCLMRNFTYARARALLPARGALPAAFDALRLGVDCNMTLPAGGGAAPAPAAPYYAAPPPLAGMLRTLPLPRGGAAARAWFVDAARGVDAPGCGAEAAPCATLSAALARSRAEGGGGALVLRGGAPHALRAPLALDARDSGLTLAAYPGEAPLVSGGAHLAPLAWARVGSSPDPAANATVWAAPLPAGVAAPFSSLFGPDARRATRARFPNGNPEAADGQMPDGYTKAASWAPPWPPVAPLVQQRPELGTEPRAACPRDACTAGGPSGGGPPWAIFCCFFWATGASVENFTTGSFWGTQPGPPGGSSYHVPGGMVAGPDLLPRLVGWAAPAGAVLHAFHGDYWGSWQFEMQSINSSSGAFTFSRGGFQEARGAAAGDYMYVENVREELDAPGEWFVDAAARMLYYCANGTDSPPSAGWVAGQLGNLFTLAGSAAAPVTNVAIAGLTFAFTEPTFLQPFTTPSGGDWSFQDGGALRLTGTRNCSVSGALFVNLGGSGVMLSGWNRDAAVTDSEFLWLGDSAVISAGLGGSEHDNSAPGASVGSGLLLARNLAHELGLFVKQAGFYYHAMTANVTVVENVLFNGPRAGININDGYAGGHDISRNVAFNFVRETSDHGPLNTWDRNTYRWRAGAGGTDPLVSRLDQNIFVANYHAVVPIDHDDGSSDWADTRNVLVWGGTKNLMGHDKHSTGNVMVYVDYAPALVMPRLAERVGWSAPQAKPPMCAGVVTPYPSAATADSWMNNTCIAAAAASFFRFFACNASAPLDGGIPAPLGGNRYYSAGATYALRCGATTWGLADAQARGVDVGSTLHELPTADELLEIVRDALL